ncbi:MAG TPA: hypothetical protein PLH94_10415 [Fimbriimonadaceae bacterium]|nr:hypothetical protein [Fimbriimonadaceae bacterium]
MNGHRQRLDAVRESLVGLDGLSLVDQARSVFLHLLNEIADAPSGAITLQPGTCPNCDTPTASRRTPYCSEDCRAAAALVRQVRSGIATTVATDPDRQVAFGQTIWRLLGGGMPLRRSLAPERAVRQAIARFEGRCAVCGDPATDVDHIGSG